MYNTLLESIVLYCTILPCNALYFTLLYYAALYCIVVNCTILFSTILYCSVPYCNSRHNDRTVSTVRRCNLISGLLHIIGTSLAL